MTDAEAADREFIVKVGGALRRLMRDQDEDDGGEPIGPIIRAHLGREARGLPVLTEQLESWELPALQLGIDAMLARPGWSGRVLGLSGEDKRYMALSLSDLVAGERRRVGPPEFVNAPIGPDETLACLDFAVILVSGPPEPACLLIRRGDDHGPASGLAAQAMAPTQAVAAALLADLKAEMERLDVYRGQVIAIEMTRMGESRLAFLERPSVDRADLVLPEGTLDRIERHVAGPTRHREALLGAAATCRGGCCCGGRRGPARRSRCATSPPFSRRRRSSCCRGPASGWWARSGASRAVWRRRWWSWRTSTSSPRSASGPTAGAGRSSSS